MSIIIENTFQTSRAKIYSHKPKVFCPFCYYVETTLKAITLITLTWFSMMAKKSAHTVRMGFYFYFSFIFSQQCWRRKEHEHALDWGTYNVEKSEHVRTEFVGELRTSPVTGKPEKYFPAWKRRIRYLISFLISLPFLSLGVGAMILSLNLNGYIHDKESPIYFASLSHFAEPVSYSFCNNTGISN